MWRRAVPILTGLCAAPLFGAVTFAIIASAAGGAGSDHTIAAGCLGIVARWNVFVAGPSPLN